MNAALWSAVAIALLSAAVGIYTARQSRKAADKSVEAQAYTRAQAINKDAFERLEADVARLSRDLVAERQDHSVTRARVARLEEFIRRSGLTVPNGM